MSEVKRISVFMHGPNKKVDMVEAAYFDRVTAERDELKRLLDHKEQQRESELRNGQAGDRLVGELQQRLTAADEQVGLAVNLLEIWRTWLGATRESCDEAGKRIWGRIDAVTAFKPAKGGGDA